MGEGATEKDQFEAEYRADLAELEEVNHSEDGDIQTVSGSAFLGFGTSLRWRVPVPGYKGVYIELRPARGAWTPAGGSTSSIFFQRSGTGAKPLLRLDYGYNVNTGRVDYHWNVDKTPSFAKDLFRIVNHMQAGKLGKATFYVGKLFKYGGKAFRVTATAKDAYTILVAKKKIREILRVAAGWSAAGYGCKAVGSAGAAIGLRVPGGHTKAAATAVFGLGGCLIGSAGAYFGAGWAAEKTYDYVEETFFEPLVPEE